MGAETDDGRSWGQRISEMVEVIDHWQGRTTAAVTKPTERVEPGSELDDDDRKTQPWPTSAAVWSALGMAVDHLGLATDALRREGGYRLRPYAFQSLCRAAMIPAARAVWLQTGSAEDRRRRAYFLAWEDTLGSRTFLSDLTKDEGLDESLRAQIPALLTKREEHLVRIKNQLKISPKTRTPPHKEASTTAMLRDVAAIIGAEDPWLRRSYTSEWRLASGAAHGLVWPTLVRPGETLESVDGGPMLSRISTGSEEAHAISLGGPVLTLQHAWELWDERRVAIPRS